MESNETNRALSEQAPQGSVEPTEPVLQKGPDTAPKYKITFEGDVAIKLHQISDVLKKRGVEIKKLWNMIGEEILRKPDSSWNKWMEEVTPGEFYLDAIKNDPEMEARLEAFLKNMYLSKGRGPRLRKEPKQSSVEPDTSTPEGQ